MKVRWAHSGAMREERRGHVTRSGHRHDELRSAKRQALVTMTSVAVVGGGFAGFECARHLARRLRKHNALADISIISPVDYMLYTPLLPDVAGGVVDAASSRSRSPTRCAAYGRSAAGSTVSTSTGAQSRSPTPESACAACRGIALF